MATQSPETEDDGGYTLTPPTGTAYERMRSVRPSHFRRGLAGRLTAYAVLFGVLGVAAGQEWLAALSETGGSAPVGVAPGPGLVGGSMLFATAVALLGSAVYRRRAEPMTEHTALRVLAVEDWATYLGLITGGLTVLLAVGGPTVGVGPLTSAGAEGSAVVGVLAVGATASATACWAASQWLDGRLPGA